MSTLAVLSKILIIWFLTSFSVMALLVVIREYVTLKEERRDNHQ